MTAVSAAHISAGYGKKQVIFNVSIELAPSEIVVVAGANGSGKTTLLKVLSRLIPLWPEPSSVIRLRGEDITAVQAHLLVRRGLIFLQQKDELYEPLTVQENLETALLHLGDPREIQKRLREVFDTLPILANERTKSAERLSGGQRKLLSMGIALANRPKVVLWDEPLAGLSQDVVPHVIELLARWKHEAVAVLLVEHEVEPLFAMADRVLLMRNGTLDQHPALSLEDVNKRLLS